MKALFDMLSERSSFSKPTDSGISPSNLFWEKSSAVRTFRIRTISISFPLLFKYY